MEAGVGAIMIFDEYVNECRCKECRENKGVRARKGIFFFLNPSADAYVSHFLCCASMF